MRGGGALFDRGAAGGAYPPPTPALPEPVCAREAEKTSCGVVGRGVPGCPGEAHARGAAPGAPPH